MGYDASGIAYPVDALDRSCEAELPAQKAGEVDLGLYVTQGKPRYRHLLAELANRLADRIVIAHLVDKWRQTSDPPQCVTRHCNGRAAAWMRQSQAQANDRTG